MSSPTDLRRMPSPIFNTSILTLPTSILHRIIHWRLALPPSIPSAINENASRTDMDHWDNLAGNKGRQHWKERTSARQDVQSAALDLMLVCKAWKPVVQKYLYAEPHLNHNLFSVVDRIVQGDKRWSNLCLRPDSTPGRYLSHLDLSNLNDGYDPPHFVSICRACEELLPLLPSVTHLKLPAGRNPFSLRSIQDAPFRKKLRYLEGLQVTHMVKDKKDLDVSLLRLLPSLEVISLVGGLYGSYGFEWDNNVQDLLVLPRLHTLKILNLQDGLLLDTLTRSELPNLNRLLITAYQNNLSNDEFVHRHGSKILSLTYLASNEWPTSGDPPSAQTLELFPNLLHLSLLISSKLISPDIFANAPNDHPLQRLTVQKWINTNHHTSSTQSTNTSSDDSFMKILHRNPPRNLQIITVDNYRWVKPSLGRAAMEAGDSGAMRDWSSKLASKGIEMRDMDGNTAPKTPRSPTIGMHVRMSSSGMEREKERDRGRRRGSLESCDEDGG